MGYAIRTPPDCVSSGAQSQQNDVTPSDTEFSTQRCYILSSSPLSSVLFPRFFFQNCRCAKFSLSNFIWSRTPLERLIKTGVSKHPFAVSHAGVLGPIQSSSIHVSYSRVPSTRLRNALFTEIGVTHHLCVPQPIAVLSDMILFSKTCEVQVNWWRSSTGWWTHRDLNTSAGG